MSLDPSGGDLWDRLEVAAPLALLAMAATTYLTRVGGLLIMSRVPMTRRVERFLEALSGSVLVALLVPAAVAGDAGSRAAILAALGVMAATRQTLAALAAGVAAAVLMRTLLG